MNKTTYLKSGRKAGAKAAQLTAALTGLLTGRRRKALKAYAYSLCHDWVQAEELVQDACYRALKAGVKRYQAGLSARPYIERIMRNAFFDDSKRLAVRLRVADVGDLEGEPLWERVADGCPDTLDELVRRDQAAGVAAAVTRLPKRQRDAVTLCDLRDVGYRDAARRLGVPMGTLRSRLSRGRAAVRRTLVTAGRGAA